jgi:predicted transposase/invertase (TIGR01784 family)
VARISNFTERELKQYEAAMMNRHDQKAILAYAKEKGEARGLARGKKEGILQTAKNMLAKGYSIAEIIGITNLSREQLRVLKRA